MTDLKNELCTNTNCEDGVVDLGGTMGVTICSICEYIKEKIKHYANQRVIEELEDLKLCHGVCIDLEIEIDEIIKELKQ